MEKKQISTKQIGYIHGLARKAGMDNDTLHVFVERITKKDSIKALTSYQGKLVIDALREATGEKVETTTPRGMATNEQQRLIYALARQLGWADDPSRLRAWLESRYQASHPRFLADQAAAKCIEAMKAMIKGKRGERKLQL